MAAESGAAASGCKACLESPPALLEAKLAWEVSSSKAASKGNPSLCCCTDVSHVTAPKRLWRVPWDSPCCWDTSLNSPGN